VLKEKSEKPVYLVVVGRQRTDDPLDYQKLAEPLGDYIRFFPRFIPPEDIPVYFSASDLVALPYRFIYQSGVLAHCMAYGKPVVANDIEGFRDYLPEYPGPWSKPGDVDSLADALCCMLNDEELRKQSADYMTKLSKTEYSWKTIGADYLRIIRDVLDQL